MNLKNCTTPFECRIWTELNAIVSDDFGNMALSIKPLDDAFMRAYELGQQQGWKLAISEAAHEARMGMVHTDAEEYSCSLIAERIRALKIPTQEKAG